METITNTAAKVAGQTARILNCLSPRIILHPLAVERLTRFGNYTIRGQMVNLLRTKRNLYQYNEKEISVRNNVIIKDDLDSCFITDTLTGENYPLYLEVRCGTCECCKESKVSSFVQRCEMESMLYPCKPLFLTLTYNEENKPKDGVSVREIQLFFKRFRINLERAGYRERIRYVCCSEYGKWNGRESNSYRPHYHAIIWNLHQNDLVEFREIGEILKRSWNKGFIYARLVDASDNKTFYYTAKYLRKDCHVPEGCNPTFICSSNRGGGIGSAYIDALAGHIVKTLDTTPQFRNNFNGAVKEVQMSSYVLDRVLPSISKSIPSKVKNALRTLNLCYTQMMADDDPNISMFSENYHKFNELFGKYFYAPQLSVSELRGMSSCLKSSQACLRDALESDMILERWFSKGKEYFDCALILNDRRALYLCKLFEHVPEVTMDYVNLRAFKARRNRAAQQARLQI